MKQQWRTLKAEQAIANNCGGSTGRPYHKNLLGGMM
jgi:hypothetical protein